MTPTEFKEQFVLPNIADMKADVGNIRLAYNCVFTLDAFAAQIYTWGKSGPGSKITARDDSAYRGQLARKNADFRLVRDIAKAMKHVELTRPARKKPVITKSSEIKAKPIGVLGSGKWDDEALWHDEARWNSGPDPLPQVGVTDANGKFRTIERLVDNSLRFLENELSQL